MGDAKEKMDLFNALSHLAGALLAVAGLVLMVIFAAREGGPWHVVSFAIFGSSLVLLYSASTLYHFFPSRSRAGRVFHRIDHIMIFVLIAGTYTPVCLVPLRGGWGWSLFGVTWGIAVAGILSKAIWFRAPKWSAIIIYLTMGWLAVFAFYPLTRTIPFMGLFWLVGGGVFYSIGAVFYGIDKKHPTGKWIDYHGIFHLFVLLGSLCHFWLMFRYVLYL